jgi:hypothetical protein
MQLHDRQLVAEYDEVSDLGIIRYIDTNNKLKGVLSMK